MNQKKVSIIITAYSPASKPYLDLLMESVALLAYENKEVIIVSPKNYAPVYDGAKTISPDWQKDLGNDAALNFGIRNSDINSEYLFLLNDDVLLTRDCLAHLVQTAQFSNDDCLLMPISNDMQQRYAVHCPLPSGPYKYDDIKDIAKDLMICSSPYPNGLMFFDTLCLYACLIPRKIIDGVGLFDEGFSTGQADVDLSLRVIRAGFRNAIVLNSLVYHAGGVTADKTQNEEARIKNTAYFESKWGKGVLQGFNG